MKWYYTVTIVVVATAIGLLAGSESFKMKHECTVDKKTGKATCSK